jgi:hypothetical protein
MSNSKLSLLFHRAAVPTGVASASFPLAIAAPDLILQSIAALNVGIGVAWTFFSISRVLEEIPDSDGPVMTQPTPSAQPS